MLYYIGLFILSHLLIGFIIGIKHVFVDGTYEDIKNFRNDKDIISDEDYEILEISEKLISKPTNYIILITVMGYVALYTEIQLLFITIKYGLRRLKVRISNKRKIRRTKSLNKKIEKFNSDYGKKEN